MIYRIQRLYNKYTKLNYIEDFLAGSKSFLDIGSGDCHLSLLLKDGGYDVTSLDVSNFSRTSINPIVYDGTTIPFTDNSFDVSFLIFVLHHDTNNRALLKEAVRVTTKRLIVFEEVSDSPLELFFTKIFDTFWNSFEGIKAPLCFRKEPEWEKLFRENGLIVYHKEEHRHLEALFTCRYVMYVLDKNPT